MNIPEIQKKMQDECKEDYELQILKDQLEDAESNLEGARAHKVYAERQFQEADDDLEHWKCEVSALKEQLEDAQNVPA